MGNLNGLPSATNVASSIQTILLAIIVTVLTGSYLGIAHADSSPVAASLAKKEAAQLDWFAMPPAEKLQASRKKVFAHYFTPFPLTIGNPEPASDYYSTQYLRASGEKGKWATKGGFLRQRPLPRPPYVASPDRADIDIELEVRRAINAGIDGFTVDLLATPNPHNNAWSRTIALINAAERVDPSFVIVPMPDMTAGYKDSPELITDAVIALSRYPNVYRLPDGRVVVSPFCAHLKSPEWWANWLETMKSKGVPVALLPLFQAWRDHVKDYAAESIGASDWGLRSVRSNIKSFADAADFAHKYVPIYMAPVAPQDYRPKGPMAWEASNSENYRTMWRNAIDGGADWVQLITWNDYSESTEVSPSTGTQFGFYDLTAYYTSWFKTGKAPRITKDVVYYFHRIQRTDTPYDAVKQPVPTRVIDGDPTVNDVELLAFLTKPGTLEILSGGKTYSMQAPAGMTSFRAPLAVGTPSFRLVRGGKAIIELTSAFPVVPSLIYQDYLYRSGGSNRPVVDAVQSGLPAP
ncbi:MAG TPA: glycoside hydrolase family 71 protein [Capsulimonadaceae bacterium]